MKSILSEIEIEIYRLVNNPAINRKARALFQAAGAVQTGAKTLQEVIGLLNNPNLEGFNLPDEYGARAGEEMVRMLGTSELCCDSCAFRKGTIPNQCPPTIMDAMECVLTGEPFYCHNTGKLCEGWKSAKK